jgi:hypothetical protein
VDSARQELGGFGTSARVKELFIPFRMPIGISLSAKAAELWVEVGQGPLVPSTKTQSVAFPCAPSIAPVGSITAVELIMKPVPITGRTLRACCNPKISEIWSTVGSLSAKRVSELTPTLIAAIPKIILMACLNTRRSSQSLITYWGGFVRSKRPSFPTVTVELLRAVGLDGPSKRPGPALESGVKEDPDREAENALTFRGDAPLVRSG